jgi:hypothetical protein
MSLSFSTALIMVLAMFIVLFVLDLGGAVRSDNTLAAEPIVSKPAWVQTAPAE